MSRKWGPLSSEELQIQYTVLNNNCTELNFSINDSATPSFLEMSYKQK